MNRTRPPFVGCATADYSHHSTLAMLRRRHITLLATILAFAAAIASGGGVARFVHMMVAHGGSACASHAVHASHAAIAGEVHVHASASCAKSHQLCAPVTREHTPTHPTQPAVPHDDGCAVCAELAVQLPTPELASPFDLTVDVLAIVHEREAARQPRIPAPRVFAARPPPALL